MGYELYREVKVWAPPSLTHREKLTAMVLADDANDRTRLTWNSVVNPEIMRQAMVKNDRDMRKILAKLQDEKVIESAGGGHNGRIAKFRFLHLDPVGCPGESACGCPLALAVQKEPATEPADAGPVQKEPATSGVAGSNWHRSRSESDPPTPSPSSTTSPLSAAERVVRDSGVVAEHERETFIDWINNQHQPRGPAWWRTVAKNGDLADLAEKWRAEQTTTAPSLPPCCERCRAENPHAERNVRWRRRDGQPCPDCHPDFPRSEAS